MVFGKVGSFLRVIGWIWLGFGAITAASTLIDGGLLQADADADAVITALVAGLGSAVPGFILLAVGSGLRRKAGRAGPGQRMTFRQAISRAGAAVADHNARQLARIKEAKPEATETTGLVAMASPKPSEPLPSKPARKGPPTVSGRSGQRRSVIER
ncbi:MAG: hypothetical protein WD673_05880 [Alphaproteobacteria bacterium]